MEVIFHFLSFVHIMMTSITLVFFCLFILAISGEAWYSYRTQKGWYDTPDTLVSISFGVLGVLTRILLKGGSLACWFWLYEWSPLRMGSSAGYIFLLFLCNELIYYWFHRISHEVRFFWATHVNHHSSMTLNFSTATRTPFLNAVYHTLFWVPLPLLGFHPADILMVETVSFFFAFFQHTQMVPRLGWIGWVLNTPSHHRVHHASNPAYRDKNFGNVLIIFDRLFGTFVPEGEPPVYGISNNPANRNFVNLVFHEWRDLIHDMLRRPRHT